MKNLNTFAENVKKTETVRHLTHLASHSPGNTYCIITLEREWGDYGRDPVCVFSDDDPLHLDVAEESAELGRIVALAVHRIELPDGGIFHLAMSKEDFIAHKKNGQPIRLIPAPGFFQLQLSGHPVDWDDPQIAIEISPLRKYETVWDPQTGGPIDE